MFAKQLFTAVGTVAGLTGLIVAGTLLPSPRVHADDGHNSGDELILGVNYPIAAHVEKPSED